MDLSSWTDWIAALAIVVVSILGMLLTAFTLPGLWLNIILVFVIWWFWKPHFYESPGWTFGGALAIAVIGEIAEFVAGAAGAAKGGSSRAGAIGAMVGAIAGAILMVPVLPPLGTIVGGVLGAAAGTILVERGYKNRTWQHSMQAGTGAAIGRALATIAKTLCAIAVALILCVGAFWGRPPVSLAPPPTPEAAPLTPQVDPGSVATPHAP
jgi:uncharacterized protein YqgC (DUF456 family)